MNIVYIVKYRYEVQEQKEVRYVVLAHTGLFRALIITENVTVTSPNSQSSSTFRRCIIYGDENAFLNNRINKPLLVGLVKLIHPKPSFP
jgi:hypothetical protein